jgi:polyphosphate kinase 2
MKRKDYEKQLGKLHAELCQLQAWVKSRKARVVIVFEGRDAAGKGGLIKAITERVSPRVFRTVALPAPTEAEKTQLYFQRYIKQMPAGGEVVLFDRSWYNRAGVEIVMGFCNEEQRQRFLHICPMIENALIDDGIILIKYWLEVSDETQEKRFQERIEDSRKQWKLSPMDLEARRRWYAYSRARDQMLAATDTEKSPWYIVRTDDKRAARINCVTHLLRQIPYSETAAETVVLPERDVSLAYDDEKPMRARCYIDEAD